MASGVAVWLLVVSVVAVAASEVSDDSTSDPFIQSIYRSLNNTFLSEGRGHKKQKKQIMNMIIAAKIMVTSLLVPSIIGLALFASWKGITISLLSFTLALVLGLRSSQQNQGKSGETIHTVVVSDHTGHEHDFIQADQHPNSPYRRYSQPANF